MSFGFRLASRLVLLALLACIVTTITPAVRAQSDGSPASDEEAGKELAVEAMEHYQNGDYDAAYESFSKAREVYPAAQVLRMQAYTLMALERWMEAAETLEAALESDYKPLLPRDAEHAEDQLGVALSHLAMIEIVSSVAGAEVSLDGGEPQRTPHKFRLEPGRYTFVVRAEGHDEVEREVSASEGDQRTFKLDPIPPDEYKPKPRPKPTEDLPKPDEPDEPDEPMDIYGWFPGQGVVGLATAGVGLALGGVAIGTGVAGTQLRAAVIDNINAHNTSYDANCSQNTDLCRADIQLINRDGARAQDLQTTAMITGIVGGSLFAVGTTLFLLSSESPLAPEGGDSAFSCVPGIGPAGGALSCGASF